MSVDTRVVSMVFDGVKFASGIASAIGSLNQLDSTVNGMNSSGLYEWGVAVETVAGKFSMWEQVATRVVWNITDTIQRKLTSVGKALSVDQVMAGWEKYAEKTTAMQTIINNAHKEDGTAYSLAEVNAELEKLNWFTDETSYNFTDMVNNIGKFTSMGQNLEDSVTAMEGISVWASSAGQGVNEASRAMYNLSQAMGVGSVKLMDWRSIQNANMATEEFKNSALETAAAMGYLKKVTDAEGKTSYKVTSLAKGASKSTDGLSYSLSKLGKINIQDGLGSVGEITAANFDQSLSSGWFSSEVLMSVLKEYGKFSDALKQTVDESGMEATQLMQVMKGYESAEDGMAYLTKMVESGEMAFEDESYTVQDLAKKLDLLTSAEYAQSRKAFQAAQEAKTLAEAINAVKDAVSTTWMNIFERLMGNYEEVKKVWTTLYDYLYEIFAPLPNLLLNVLDAWRKLDDEAGGYFDLWGNGDDIDGAIWRLWDAFNTVGSLIKETWQNWFPPTTIEEKVKKLQNGIIKFSEFVEKLNNFLENNETIISITNAIASAFKILTTILSQAKNTIFAVLGYLFDTDGDGVQDIVTNLGDLITKFNKLILDSGFIEKFFERLTEVLLIVAKPIKFVISAIAKLSKAFLGFRNSNNPEEFDTYSKIAENASVVFGFLASVITDVTGALGSLWEWLKKVGRETTDVLASSGKNMEEVGTTSKFIANFITLLKKLGELIGGVLTKGMEKFNQAFEDGSIERAFEFLKNAGIIGILERIWSFLNRLTNGNVTGELVGRIESFINGLKRAISTWSQGQYVKTLKTIATSTLILVAAMMILSTLDVGELMKGVIGIAAVLYIFMTAVKSITKFSFDKQKIATIVAIMPLLYSLATAIAILALAMRIIGGMSFGDFLKGMIGVTTMAFVMVEAIDILSKNATAMKPKHARNLKKMAKAMVVMSVALLILASAVKKFGSMDFGSFLQGMIGAIGMIFILVAAMKLLDKVKIKAGVSLALISMAAALAILAAVVTKLAKLDPEEMQQGILGLAAVMVELVGMMYLLKKTGGGGSMVGFAMSMILLGSALAILANTVSALGKLSNEELLKGIAGLGVVMLELVGGLSLIPDDAAAKAASLALLAVGLAAMVIPIEALAHLSWGQLLESLLGLVVVIGSMTAALAILAPMGPSLLAVGAAFALIGVGVAAACVGVLALVTAIQELLLGGEAVIAGLPVILDIFVKAIGDMIVTIIKSITGSGEEILNFLYVLIKGVCDLIVELGPDIFAALGVIISGIILAVGESLGLLMDEITELLPKLEELIVAIWDLIIRLVPDMLLDLIVIIADFLGGVLDKFTELLPKVKDCLLAIIDLLREVIPEFIDAALDILVSVLQSIEEHMEDIVSTALKIIAAFIRGIADGLPDVIDAGFELIISFIEGLTDAINNHTGDLLTAVFELIWAVITALPKWIMDIGDKLFEFGGDILKKIWEGIKNVWTSVGEWFKNLPQRIRESVENNQGFGKVINFGKDIINKLWEGIKNAWEAVKDWFADLPNKIKEAFQNGWSKIKEIGSNIVEGIKGGIDDDEGGLWDKVSGLGNKIKGIFQKDLEIESPSKVFTRYGRYIDQGLANGIDQYSGLAARSAEGMGEDTMAAMNSVIGDIADSLNDDSDYRPTITPVLDLSQIQNGIRNMSGMFNDSNVAIAASGYNLGVSSNSQPDTVAAVNAAMKNFSDKIIDALNKKDFNPKVDLTLSSDAAKIFDSIRVKNAEYKLAYGHSAF